MKTLFGKGFDILEKAISIRTKRNTVLSSNIANVDTPGYKAKDIPFERVMAQYLQGEKRDGLELTRTQGAHLPRDYRDDPFSEKRQGIVVESMERGTPNSVDIDVEMAKLSENNLQYQTSVQLLIRRLEGLKTAITEGGKP